MIRNIIFDAANVLVNFNKVELLMQCGAACNDFEILEEEIFSNVEPLLNAGLISKKEAKKMSCTNLIKKDLNFLVPTCLAVYDRWYDFIKVNEKIANLLASLKDTGYKIYIFSNGTSELLNAINIKAWKSARPFSFNDCMFSYEVQLLKPSLTIFQKFCGKCNLVPEECLYIDSNKKNMETAKEIGMNIYEYLGYEQLKKYLISNSMILY